jgi:uncharacterized small protein (TIGR04563 family)
MIGGSAIGNVGGSGTLTANGKRRGRPPGSGKGGIGSGFNVGGGGSTSDKRKASIYLPDGMLEQVSAHGARLDRSNSKMIQIAWKLALAQIEAMDGIDTDDE